MAAAPRGSNKLVTKRGGFGYSRMGKARSRPEGDDLNGRYTCQAPYLIFALSSPQTYTSYIAGIGLRRPIGHQKAYVEVSKFFYSQLDAAHALTVPVVPEATASVPVVPEASPLPNEPGGLALLGFHQLHEAWQ